MIAIDKAGRLSEAEAQTAIDGALDGVDVAMSNWRADSEISRFNAQSGTEDVAISPALHAVMQAAEDVHLASLGRFDTAAGPLIELWGFGASGALNRPAETAIAAQRARSGHSNVVRLGESALRKTQEDAQIYLAGIGKGFGADKVGQALEGLGVRDYMVEIGGDLYASGVNPDGVPWQIGIETPNTTDRGVFAVVGLSGMGLATSGDYRNYFEEGGRRFSHLIDPTTGYPVTHATASATVLAENAMLADAWSTAMLILGREQGLDVAAEHGIAVQFIDRDTSSGSGGFRTHLSPRFREITA
ncbi:MAG: FAD:protein FMN transferase [Pseudomonadota bacterium]